MIAESDRPVSAARQATAALSKNARRFRRPVRGSVVASWISSTLQKGQAICRPQSRAQFLRKRRLTNEIVGTVIKCLRRQAIVAGRRHHPDEQRSPRAGELARLRAQRDSGDVTQLHAGQQSPNVSVDRKVIERSSAFAERKHLVLALTDHIGHRPLHRATWIDEHNSHSKPGKLCLNGPTNLRIH